MKHKKIEWTLIIAVVAGALQWFAMNSWFNLTAERASLWIVAINAVAGAVAAWKTRPLPPQVYTYAVSALAAVATAYGLHWSVEQVSSMSTLVLAVLALLTRAQVAPEADIRQGLVAPDGMNRGHRVIDGHTA